VIFISHSLIKRFADSIPGLPLKLQQAGMPDSPELFVKKILLTALYVTTGLMIFVIGVFSHSNIPKNVFFVIFIFLLVFTFFYFMKTPDARISRKEKEINKEIVFAGRFIIIELESGVSLYNAMVNVQKNYEIMGPYFKEITDRIDLGTSVEDAINHSIETTPSSNFRKILWQMLNVLKTGTDVSRSLNSVLDQIVKEQMIEVKGYAKKLSPLAMFYMIVAVIIPSLGITMLLVVSSFLSLNLGLAFLLSVTGLLAFVQFMFLNIIKFSRPGVDL